MDVQRERLSITYGLPLHAVCFDELLWDTYIHRRFSDPTLSTTFHVPKKASPLSFYSLAVLYTATSSQPNIRFY